MIRLNDKQLRELQKIELEMLIEIDRICKIYNIQYNAIGGTLLGAIRHGGFIPWDDDADVAFLREEYEKFRIACETELDHDRFYFQDHRNTPGYRWGYGKLRRKGTLFLREGQEYMPYEQGVFIDLFPVDNSPNTRFGRNIQNAHCYCMRKIMYSLVGARTAKTSGKRRFYSVLYRIAGESIYAYFDSYVDRINQRKTKWSRFLTFPAPDKNYGYPRRLYESSARIKFEGVEINGIKDYDEFLRIQFGDYMELPPVEMRKIHPVSKLKLLEDIEAVSG